MVCLQQGGGRFVLFAIVLFANKERLGQFVTEMKSLSTGQKQQHVSSLAIILNNTINWL